MLSSLPLVLLLLLVSFSLPGFLSAQKVVAAAAAVPPRDLWCVAKNNAPDQALQQAIDWACGAGGADCGPIQQNGPCYDSSDIQRTASWAFNDYYLKNGLTDDACYFSNTAALTSLNPSHDKCKFPSSLTVNSGNFSGSTTGASTEGLSPDSADLSSCNRILSTWFWPFATSILFVVFS